MQELKIKRHRLVPGFGLTSGITFFILTLIVLIPLIALVLTSSQLSWAGFIKVALSQRVLLAYWLSIKTAIAAALVNSIFGLIIAWVLVRYDFPGKKILDGLIELPFALPTAVAGIALAYLYSDKGFMGQFLGQFGVKVAYTGLGIFLAMTFVTIPFVVREIQPVLQKLDPIYEEAADVLGARSGMIFRKVIFPELTAPIFIGFSLAFARSLGEYGSVVFIAGNVPGKTEIPALLIVSEINQAQFPAATAIALVLLVFAFLVMLGVNLVQRRLQKRIA